MALKAFSAILPLYLPKVHQSLEETSEPIREYLNDEGLYDTLHEYQLTGSARTGFSENDEQLQQSDGEKLPCCQIYA